MAAPELVVQEDDVNLQSDIVKDYIKQLRAIDTYDTYEGWSEARIIDPVVLTKERKQKIPVIGDPEEITIARLKAYYNSLATLIEKKSVQFGSNQMTTLNSLVVSISVYVSIFQAQAMISQ